MRDELDERDERDVMVLKRAFEMLSSGFISQDLSNLEASTPASQTSTFSCSCSTLLRTDSRIRRSALDLLIVYETPHAPLEIC